MLSILIPTYNYDITNLVETIWQQCKKESFSFEIIVLDDYSTNLTITKNNDDIKDLEFCKHIKNKKNMGRTATRTLLCKEAKYDWLLFLDADVMPKFNDFIQRFNLEDNNNSKVIFGGISYDYEIPNQEKLLRWEYGRKREAKPVSKRLKEPYFIISQNLMIKKSVFITSNTIDESIYGLDILFSNNLKKKKVTIIHIENPVFHLGLETTTIFIEKSLEAVKTTFLLENKNLLEQDLRPLQKSYLKLKKWNLIGFYSFIVSKFLKKMKNNFHSLKPNLFLFDLYRLHYYIQLKTEKNA
ncbi:MAG: glycosyltransferase family 2 protein [Flavobacteriaceae bacterium]|mgnify:FL=1|jgi:glycosyltransferase involved in cell wall biosynthesis|nr:glycosyltransferase family 2 protein [Flavobacteriaceae bacterium]